jgi:hypothetical protein
MLPSLVEQPSTTVSPYNPCPPLVLVGQGTGIHDANAAERLALGPFILE